MYAYEICIDIYDYERPYMITIYDCMTMYDYMWLYMTRYDISLYITIYHYISLYITTYHYISLYITTHHYALYKWIFMNMYISIYTNTKKSNILEKGKVCFI